MGRKSIKAVRRQEIIKAFYKTANAEGMHNTSIAKIAEAMDVNPSLILHYFKNKDELVLALIDFILSGYRKIFAIKEDGSPLEELKGLLDNLFSRQWNSLISDDVYYNCYSLIFRSKVIQQKYKDLHDSLRQALESHLIKCQNEGLLSIESPSKSANMIFCLLDGAYVYLCMETEKDRQVEIMNDCKEQVYELLGLEYSIHA